MKVIIAGSRSVNDSDLVDKVVLEGLEALAIGVTEVVSGGAKGADKLGELWAKQNDIPVKQFIPEWDNIKAEGAKVKERVNPWTKKKEKYNCLAGFTRNQQMAEYADALIAIDMGTNGTADMIERMKKEGKPVYVYPPTGEEEYDFWNL